jgi:hypothetical protein
VRREVASAPKTEGALNPLLSSSPATGSGGLNELCAGVNSFLSRSDCFGGGFVNRVDLADENALDPRFLN